jgi:hypothetical protein
MVEAAGVPPGVRSQTLYQNIGILRPLAFLLFFHGCPVKVGF